MSGGRLIVVHVRIFRQFVSKKLREENDDQLSRKLWMTIADSILKERVVMKGATCGILIETTIQMTM